ncbi:hypothetical protein D3C78_1179160 [compost metagenome]
MENESHILIKLLPLLNFKHLFPMGDEVNMCNLWFSSRNELLFLSRHPQKNVFKWKLDESEYKLYVAEEKAGLHNE